MHAHSGKDIRIARRKLLMCEEEEKAEWADPKAVDNGTESVSTDALSGGDSEVLR